MKKQTALIIVLILAIVGLSGCTDQESNQITDIEWNRFIGTWKYEYTIFTCFSDGSGSYGGLSTFWEIKDNKFVMNIIGESATITYDYVFFDNDNILRLTNVIDGLPQNFTRQ